MNTKIKKIFENLSYSVGANVLNTLISLILVFIVPKALGVREYAYWQLYTFYTSYIVSFIWDGLTVFICGLEEKITEI